jgi:hypothetical protein
VRNNTSFVWVAVFTIALVAACKKKSSPAPASSSTTTSSSQKNLTSFDSLKPVNVHYYHSSQTFHTVVQANYKILYNSDNTVASINMHSGPTPNWTMDWFNYYPGYYTTANMDSPGVFGEGNVHLNTLGMIITSTDGYHAAITYSYTGAEITRMSTGSRYDRQYFWANDDLQFDMLPTVIYSSHKPYDSIGIRNDTTYYTYDQTKRGQVGDERQIRDFLYFGRSIIRTYDLPKSAGVTYVFDSLGRIIQYMALTLPYSYSSQYDSAIYTYQY